ncbi:WD40 repeat [Streptomyces sp. Ag82_O1-12]|uniref:WD40 repeat domain-containing protein n=1 Tax=unclassified Streptomyces TaxID=2593676 RepID=UPI000BC61661|nr:MULTISPECIES: WD40 repeat domain-containing protein [unclassified Streptomyces]SMQ17461.1 WD40 repeat [Streptomyces sp. Ag82_O1-12]SOD46495.1 WD40 repeat [Streptomyces sp. Ag82_G6-1]
MSSDSGARTAFAERLALLYKEAGNPPLKRVSEAVVRLQRVDERGRPVRVSAQRISDWRRARNVPAQFPALAAVLHVLIPDARRSRPTPVSPGLYDLGQWQRLWESAVADPVGERPSGSASAAEDGQRPADETASAPGGVCPYRGLASYRREDARWFFGRERSTDALVTQLGAVAEAGGLVMLVGASGAGKSSLLNAGLVPALRDGALGGDDGDGDGDGDGNADGSGRAREVVQLVPGGDPLAELSRCIPELAAVVSASIPPGKAPARPEAAGSEAALAERPGSSEASLAERPGPSPTERPGPSPADDPAPRQPGHPTAPEPATPPVADDRPFTTVPPPSTAPRSSTAPPDSPSPEAVRVAVSAWARRVDPSGARPVVIVDQFEETFTLCPDEADRRAFVEVLHAACSPAGPGEPAPAIVVLGIRADFYDRCLRYPELADALQHRHMVLGPLTTTELREAVTGPAKAVGLELEPGLAELIVREVSTDGPRGAHDAGVLPLLSHALLATWQRRKAGRLTLAGYRAAGGIQGAVAATAERAWTGLDPAARSAARLLLLRLVRLGEDTQATRRRGTRRQLAEESTDPGKTEESLEALVRARLVTLDAETVEITHEALLHAWPRLRDWIDEDRQGNLLRQRLEEDGRAWEESNRDASLLYRGSRLEQAHGWARSAGDTFLTRSAVEFLAASVRLRRRITWISRGAVATLVVLAMVAVGAAVVAWKQRDEAVFEQVLAQSDRMQDTDPSLSAQLDLVAHGLRPDDKGANSRLISIVNAPLSTPLSGHTGAVYLTTFSPNGRILATASYDRTVRLWDVADRKRPRPLGKPLTGHTSWVSSAVFSPDGRTLASASDDGTIRLWDVSDPGQPKSLGKPLTGHDGTIYLIAFSPDGRTLASAGDDHTVRLWNTADPRRPRALGEPLTGHTAAVRSVAFGPDGRTLAAGGDDGTIRLWDVSDPARPQPAGTPLTGHTATVHSVAFSPDGRTLASGSADSTVQLWDMAGPGRPAAIGAPLTGHTGPVWSVAFSPDGNMLAAASADSTASLWKVSDPEYPSQVGGPLAGSSGEMYALGFSPDGRTLATGAGDNKVRLWSLPTSDMTGRTGVFRPDGRLLATAARDGRIRLWDVRRPGRPVRLGEPFRPGEGDVRSLEFSPDGRTLAVVTGDRLVELWNVRDPEHPVRHGSPAPLHIRYADPLAFSPDGQVLATAYDDRTIQLWNVGDPARPRPLGKPLTGHKGYVNHLVFSPDGRTLASGSADGTIRLWNVTAPGRVTLIGKPLRGHLGAVNALAFSRDGRTLASAGDDNSVRLWDISEPAEASQQARLTGHTEAVVSLTFSRDGRTLASGGNDSTVRLWNVSDPSHATAIGQSMSPNSKTGTFLAFSPNSHMLGVSSGADTIRLWDLDVDTAVRRICSMTRGVLTQDTWREYLPRLSYDPPCDG